MEAHVIYSHVHLSTHTLARFRALISDACKRWTLSWFADFESLQSPLSHLIDFPASLFMSFAVFRKCNCCFHHLDICQLTSPGLQSLGSVFPACSLVWRLLENCKDMVCFFSPRMSTTNYSVLSHRMMRRFQGRTAGDLGWKVRNRNREADLAQQKVLFYVAAIFRTLPNVYIYIYIYIVSGIGCLPIYQAWQPDSRRCGQKGGVRIIAPLVSRQHVCKHFPKCRILANAR